VPAGAHRVEERLTFWAKSARVVSARQGEAFDA
jgi:hypothetical protein